MPTSAPSNRGFPPARAQQGFKSSRRYAQEGFKLSWRYAQQGFTSSWRYAQQGFTSSGRYAQQGFTLIEMLVVLTVLGLVAAIAAQNVGRRPAGLIREEGEAKLDLALDAARREAARTGTARTVDPASLIPGATLSGSLPAAVRQGLIVIYPDGSSNGGLVTAAGAPVARIDWLTGEARDAS